ncbi:transposase [Streptomyces sp. NPDC056121]|uniref:transposase n=1 Tax=Streptomyces sp. NPDC056121 TaxID=3345718 RepID=UPI0035D87BB2
MHVASTSTYGVQRIHAEPRRQGLVNHKRLKGLMREHGSPGTAAVPGVASCPPCRTQGRSGLEPVHRAEQPAPS